MAQPVLVIMAAGMGSRYGGLKQIDPVGPDGQIIMDYSIYDAWRAGFRRVVFIIKQDLHEAFHARIGAKTEQLMQVDYVYQSTDILPEGCACPADREKPLGTGHAIYCLRDVMDAPFAVINADDFYGADAFQKLYDYLSTAQDDDKFRYCMVGYRIENTLTEHGTVARGVCTTDGQSYLTGITERTRISIDKQGVISDPEAGIIPAGTTVSLNTWGFTPSILKELDTGLREFFSPTGKMAANPQKAEYYLPSAVDHLLQTGQATVQVLPTSAKWYGVTYQDDKPKLAEALRHMTEAGDYPAK